MARISELHYSNAYAASSGIAEFIEIALTPPEDPADFTVSFYQANGQVGLQVPLTDPAVQVSTDPDNNEVLYVIQDGPFNVRLTDPDGGGANNYEAFALVDTSSGDTVVFLDIGGGTQNITAVDGLAAGATSTNVPVQTNPGATTTSLQFNQPNPDDLTYEPASPGDTGPACFVAGTLIETPDGLREIETLEPGDLVLTQDGGVQPVRWVGSQTVSAQGRFAPIRISPGTLGATEPVRVSPQHRLLIQGWQAELYFGLPEVLVAAKELVNGSTVRVTPMDRVTYYHILFDRHEIVYASGLASESFYPGQRALDGLGAGPLNEVLDLFPQLADLPDTYGAVARPIRSGREARAVRLI